MNKEEIQVEIRRLDDSMAACDMGRNFWCGMTRLSFQSMQSSKTRLEEQLKEITQEEALQNRDDMVRARLLDVLQGIDADMHIARCELAAMEDEKRRILCAVQDENWFILTGTLTGDDIESLCEVSPTGLLDDC